MTQFARGLGMMAAGLVLTAAPRAVGFCPLDTVWAEGVVPMAYNFPDSGPLLNDTSSWGENAESAMIAWSTITDAFRFVSRGPGDAPGSNRDGVNNMVFADNIDGHPIEGGVLALTFTRTDRNGKVMEGDVIFNSSVRWDAYGGPLRLGRDGVAIFDFQRVALHELGHVLGLDHPDASCDQFVEAVMNAHITDTDELAIDDRNGASFLYAGGNQPPIADAGPNLFGNGTAPFVLDATGSSDPDGRIVSYEWRLRNEVVARTALASVDLTFGTHVVALTVTDNDGAAARDTLIVEVGLSAPSGDPQNTPPIADAGLDLKVPSGELAVLDATDSFDPDGSIERYVWNEGSAILGRDAITPIALSIGTHDITLTVFDDDGASASDTVAVAVIFDETVDTGPVVNSPPPVVSPSPACGTMGMMSVIIAFAPFAGRTLRRVVRRPLCGKVCVIAGHVRAH